MRAPFPSTAMLCVFIAAMLATVCALSGSSLARAFSNNPHHKQILEYAAGHSFDLRLNDREPTSTEAMYLVLKAAAVNKALIIPHVATLVHTLISSHGANPVADVNGKVPMDNLIGMANNSNVHLLINELLVPIVHSNACGAWTTANEILRGLLANCNSKAVAAFADNPCMQPFQPTDLVHAISWDKYGPACQTGYTIIAAKATTEQLIFAVSLPWASSWQYEAYEKALNARSVAHGAESSTRKQMRAKFNEYKLSNGKKYENIAYYNVQKKIVGEVKLTAEEISKFIVLAAQYSPNIANDAIEILVSLVSVPHANLSPILSIVPNAQDAIRSAIIVHARHENAVPLYRLFQLPESAALSIDDPSPSNAAIPMGMAVIRELVKDCSEPQIQILEAVPQADWSKLFSIFTSIVPEEYSMMKQVGYDIPGEVYRVAKLQLGGEKFALPFVQDDLILEYERNAKQPKFDKIVQAAGQAYMKGYNKRICYLFTKALETSSSGLLNGLCQGVEQTMKLIILRTVCGDSVLDAAKKAKPIPAKKIKKLYGVTAAVGQSSGKTESEPMMPSDTENDMSLANKSSSDVPTTQDSSTGDGSKVTSSDTSLGGTSGHGTATSSSKAGNNVNGQGDTRDNAATGNKSGPSGGGANIHTGPHGSGTAIKISTPDSNGITSIGGPPGKSGSVTTAGGTSNRVTSTSSNVAGIGVYNSVPISPAGGVHGLGSKGTSGSGGKTHSTGQGQKTYSRESSGSHVNGTATSDQRTSGAISSVRPKNLAATAAGLLYGLVIMIV